MFYFFLFLLKRFIFDIDFYYIIFVGFVFMIFDFDFLSIKIVGYLRNKGN